MKKKESKLKHNTSSKALRNNAGLFFISGVCKELLGKKLKLFLIIWFALCLYSIFGYRGCVTSALYNSTLSRHGFPDVTFHCGYSHEDKIILEYYDIDGYKNIEWWHAIGTTNNLANWEIHSRKLDPTAVKEYDKILIELDEYKANSEEKKFQADRIENALPQQRYVLRKVGKDRYQLTRFSPVDKNYQKTYAFSSDVMALKIQSSPRKYFKYLKLVAYWPFAVIADYIGILIFIIVTGGVRING